MREHIPDESVDLVYLDPPFNSQTTYNVLFAEKNGSQSTAQITAFEDTWHWGREAESTYLEVVHQPGNLADLLVALRSVLGENDMMAYLVMMAPRLAELHRVLKPTGSIYLHCDTVASHYLKLLMDSIFKPQFFRNEIVWKRTSSHGDAQKYGRVHDIILHYSKTDSPFWNTIYQEYEQGYIDQYYRYKDPDGRRFMSADLTGAGAGPPRYFGERGLISPPDGRHWMYDQEGIDRLLAENRIYWTRNGIPRLKAYLDEAKGMPAQDVWTDIEALRSWHKERLGYPTQKPEALLERIIGASSNEGDLVLDPFCGCGTTIAVAERLNRRWIGIDITYLAISLMKTRLQDAFAGELSPYEVIGDPKDFWSAKALAEENRFQFEWWAVGKVGAYPAQDKKKGADSGIDGIIKFFDDKSGKPKKIIVQVKSGNVQVNQIRDLMGVVKREKAVIGVFITLNSPTKPMEIEAVREGFYIPEHFPKDRYPRIQILTIEDILKEASIQYPRLADATFKTAERKYKAQVPTQSKLL
jgi:DNA modification methylase